MLALPVQYRQMLEADPLRGALLGPDATRGVVLAINRAYLSALGMSHERVLGHSVFDSLAPLTAADVIDGLRASLARVVARREPERAPVRSFELPGGPQRFTVLHTPVLDEGGCVQLIWQRLEEVAGPAIDDEAEQLRQVIEGSPYAVAMLDRAMCYLFVSQRWRTDFQLPQTNAQLRGRSHYQIFPEIPEHWKAIHRRALAGEVVREEAEAFRREDGTIHWLRWEVRPWHGHEGQVHGILIFSEDISAARRATDELRRWEYVFRNVSWGLSLASPDGRIIYVNPAFAAMHGTRAEDWTGRAVGDMLAESSRHLLGELTARARETGHLVYESIHARADGSEFPVLTEVSEFKDQRGNVLFSAANYRDQSASKAAEQSLLESEARFRGTFDNAAVGIAHVGVDGHWLRVNDKLCSIVGYSRDELLSLTFQDVTHPEDLATDLAYVAQVVSGEIPNYSLEKRYIRRDGSLIWINLTVSLARTPRGEPDYFISIIEDISARKHVSLALRESEARFRALAENMSQLAWMANETGARFWFNQRWLDYTGTSLSQVQGFRWTHVHRPEERARIAAEHQARCALGQPWTASYELLDARGEPRWFLTQVVPLRDDAGRVIRWFGTHTDVTAEREAQRAQERARFFELSLDLMCIASCTGGFLHLSPRFSATLGYPLHELLGRSLLDIVHPDDHAATRQDLHSATPEAPSREFTRRFRCQDGSYRWLQWRWASDPSGMSYAIARDVTDDRELLESLQRAQTSLSAGLREREVLLQEIHHRVKNNLQVISSLINMQARKLDQPAARTALEECKTRVEAIALIHEQLYQSKDYRQIPFAKYVSVLIQNIRSVAGSPAQRVTLDVDDDQLALPVDRAIPCGLILNELITNALKHAFPQGRSGQVQVSLRSATDALALSVADDGVGMVRPKPGTAWQSLGMQLVETLVEQIDGQLRILQAEGTTFRVVCPLRTRR